jgi:hypothetical protein
MWSRDAVDRNGCKNFRTKERIKGETASRRAEGAPLTRSFVRKNADPCDRRLSLILSI